MKSYKMLQAASLSASYTDYEDFLNEDGTKEQLKTWTFTADDLKKFLTALEVLKK